MPEFVVSVTSSLNGHSDLAIGNVIGSNLANMFLILGVCAAIRPLKFQRETRIFENPFTILITILLFFMCINGAGDDKNIITRGEGIVLLVLCALFILYNIIMARKGEAFDLDDALVQIQTDSENADVPVLKSVIAIIAGIIGLKIGGDLVVDGAVEIATLLGLSESLISLTIVAFSTSLPELITSITATIKGETDMAIGNVLGSQIFNILLIIGASAFLSPIEYSTSYNKDICLLTMGSVLLALFPFIGKKNEMSRSNGITFVTVYVLYIVSLVYFNI
jgi:cation:H+ antiporter